MLIAHLNGTETVSKNKKINERPIKNKIQRQTISYSF